ncbi:LADA_0F00342g1_1 [Lachancea dasiensis]|uniref:LADA_0F00342g1_1 n=1 Tax=Lachancea dasiensis TaxID=1072105 RepID=A0A1G4JHR4_9SACH|nr:LADA_0F00342g1_1 [Lachancea dasiensis]
MRPHMQQSSMNLPKSSRISHVCDACRQRKLKCNKEKPSCSRCAKLGLQCVYTPYRKKNHEATAVKTLESEIQYLRAQLAATASISRSTSASPSTSWPATCGSAGSGEGSAKEHVIDWDALVTPVYIDGVWRSHYAPFTDLALFARDPLLTGRVAELFEQEIASPKTTNLSLHDDLFTTILSILPNPQILSEARTAFATTIYPSYPFIDLEVFNQFFDKIVSKSPSLGDGPESPSLLLLTLSALCLTKHLTIDPDVLLQWADSLHVSRAVSETNLACLLYLKLCYRPGGPSLTPGGTLSECIRKMALEMGLYSSSGHLVNRRVRQHLWMACVVLSEPNTFDEYHLVQFGRGQLSQDTPLSHLYEVSTRVSKVWKCAMTASGELDDALLALCHYNDAKVTATQARRCTDLRVAGLKFNLLTMQFLQDEKSLTTNEDAVRETRRAFDDACHLLSVCSVEMEMAYPYLAAASFLIKTVGAYALGMCPRLLAKSRHLEAQELSNEFERVVQTWSPTFEWCQKIRHVLKVVTDGASQSSSLFSGGHAQQQLSNNALEVDPIKLLEEALPPATQQLPQPIIDPNDLSPSLSSDSVDSYLGDSFAELEGPWRLISSESVSTSSTDGGAHDFDFDYFLKYQLNPSSSIHTLYN